MRIKHIVAAAIAAGVGIMVDHHAYADELDDANAKCVPHLIQPTPSLRPRPTTWSAGWEHCETIVQAWAKRKSDRDASDEATNPDLKATRDLAKKLGAENAK